MILTLLFSTNYNNHPIVKYNSHPTDGRSINPTRTPLNRLNINTNTNKRITDFRILRNQNQSGSTNKENVPSEDVKNLLKRQINAANLLLDKTQQPSADEKRNAINECYASFPQEKETWENLEKEYKLKEDGLMVYMLFQMYCYSIIDDEATKSSIMEIFNINAVNTFLNSTDDNQKSDLVKAYCDCFLNKEKVIQLGLINTSLPAQIFVDKILSHILVTISDENTKSRIENHLADDRKNGYNSSSRFHYFLKY